MHYRHDIAAEPCSDLAAAVARQPAPWPLYYCWPQTESEPAVSPPLCWWWYCWGPASWLGRLLQSARPRWYCCRFMT